MLLAGKHSLNSSIPTKKSTATSASQCNRVSASSDTRLLALMLSKMQTGGSAAVAHTWLSVLCAARFHSLSSTEAAFLQPLTQLHLF